MTILRIFDDRLYQRWVLLPVLAHMLSFMAGIVGIVLFPILVTVAQYLVFRSHPAVARPGLWFVTIPVTFFIWMKWGPYLATIKQQTIQNGVVAYYIGQLINTLFIPLIIRKEKPEFLLSWILSNLVAGIVWIILYDFATNWLGVQYSVEGNTALFILYPTIALLANSVSGFFLTNRMVYQS
ncbi:hypothetical protein [Spirosoma endbachense]|uniref:Uncharacterized protein n=1 Tax=Spirosoma endbachense TaxID=2666025 RepID=A0A6P1W738_9BACT|nr:hypothetical protein [Spirosoma endbachense]QHW00725.1 hypothetical protein GJR95_39400 [Spirosoma endbachense]